MVCYTTCVYYGSFLVLYSPLKLYSENDDVNILSLIDEAASPWTAFVSALVDSSRAARKIGNHWTGGAGSLSLGSPGHALIRIC